MSDAPSNKEIFQRWLKTPLRCKLFFHKSDRDFSDPYWGKGIKSHCEHCHVQMSHPFINFVHIAGWKPVIFLSLIPISFVGLIIEKMIT